MRTYMVVVKPTLFMVVDAEAMSRAVVTKGLSSQRGCQQHSWLRPALIWRGGRVECVKTTESRWTWSPGTE